MGWTRTRRVGVGALTWLVLAAMSWLPSSQSLAVGQAGSSISLTAYACPAGMTANTLERDGCEPITDGFEVRITSLEGIFQPLGLADAGFDEQSYVWALGPPGSAGSNWGVEATALPNGYAVYVILGDQVTSPIGDGPYDVLLIEAAPNAAVALYFFTEADAAPAGATGRVAQVVAGTCDGGRSPLAGSFPILAPVGDPLGLPSATIAQTGVGTIPRALDDLLAAPHAVLILTETAAGPRVIACGDIGAVADGDGIAVIGLHEIADSGVVGIAYLATNATDPARTDLSVFVADGLA